MKISYGITVHNEAEELNRLLEILIHKTDAEDEIVICDDYSDEKMAEMTLLQDEIDSLQIWDIDSKIDMAMEALRCPDDSSIVSTLSLTTVCT